MNFWNRKHAALEGLGEATRQQRSSQPVIVWQVARRQVRIDISKPPRRQNREAPNQSQ